jgi:TolA-binding protein
MEKVAHYYPDSRYAPQAWMYIGESAFDDNRLVEAEDAYRRVIQYPTSRWFDEALYKLAWTHYRQSNPNMAISSFIALIDLGKRSISGKAQLQNEAMKYIAISFSEADLSGQEGLQRATEFIKRLDNRRMGIQILEKLGQIFEEQGRYALAANSYEKILQLYPYDRRRPRIEYRLVAARTRDMPPVETVERKVDYFSKFHRDGSWSSRKEDARVVKSADSLAQLMMYEAVTDLHQQALYERDTTLYSRAATYYRSYIESYPNHPNANECHYNMAEILFSLGRYEEAAHEYIAVSNRYPDSKYKENAAWNAIVASQRLLSTENPSH